MSNAERIKSGQGDRCHRCDRRFGLIRHHFASEQFCSNSPLVAAATAGAVGVGYSWATKVLKRDELARVGLNYKFN
jgi:hypothetical protein